MLADFAGSGKIAGMDARKLIKLRKDLAAFLDAVVGTLDNARRRRWCEAYVRGVLAPSFVAEGTPAIEAPLDGRRLRVRLGGR